MLEFHKEYSTMNEYVSVIYQVEQESFSSTLLQLSLHIIDKYA